MATEVKVCPRCGDVNPAVEQRCLSCWTGLADVPIAHVQEPRERKTGRIIIAVVGLFLFVGGMTFLYLNETGKERREKAQASATSVAGEATRLAWQPTRVALEATRTAQEQAMLAIVAQQRPLVEECRKLYGSESVQQGLARRGPAVPWLVREDNDKRNEVVWHPPVAVSPGVIGISPGLVTDASVVLQASKLTVVIVEVDYQLVGHYIPEGAPAQSTPNPLHLAYRVVADLCITYWPEGVVGGVGRVAIDPPKRLDYASTIFVVGRPGWQGAVEEWIAGLPESK